MEIEKTQNSARKQKHLAEETPESLPVAHQGNFPTRRALEELNEATRNHYVTKHGGGTQTDSQISAAVGPMDDEA